MCSILKEVEVGKRNDIIDERIIKPRLAAYRLIKYTERVINFLPTITDDIINDMRETERVIGKAWIYRGKLKKILENCESILFDIHAESLMGNHTTKEWNTIFQTKYKTKLNESKSLYDEVGFEKNFFAKILS